jgi:glucose-1-phosphate thymidylyltransferase
MKGILLAGGAGSRLYPMTQVLSKQLQPIYDKPMIFYPLSLLMLAGIREILVISTERDVPHIEQLLGDGSAYGIKLIYKIQSEPRGLAEAFIIGENFIAGDDVAMILGDNLFYGDIGFFRSAVDQQLEKSDQFRARVFGYYVDDPRRYGVVELEKSTGRVISIEEKPSNPKSQFALPGLYIFDGSVSARAREQKPSHRGELEITDLMQTYLDQEALGVSMIGRGVTWLDTGTPESLLEASQLINQIEKRQGLKVACLHEVALRKGFIDKEKFLREVEKIPTCPYKTYLLKVGEDF